MINNLLSKNRQILLYLIFGVLTTILSFLTYLCLVNSFLNSDNIIELQVANVISWFISIIFAYITNKKYVFSSKSNSKTEFLNFLSSRVFTLFIDMLIMFIFVSIFHINDLIIKIFSQIVVILLNYLLSKFIVFKRSV